MLSISKFDHVKAMLKVLLQPRQRTMVGPIPSLPRLQFMLSCVPMFVDKEKRVKSRTQDRPFSLKREG